MNGIQLYNAAPEVQQVCSELDEEDERRIAGFLQKVYDMRNMAGRREVDQAARYHEPLAAELEQMREHYSSLKSYVGGGAAAGAAAGAWLFGVGALVGGLAGGALGYFAAKDRKEKMLKLCDHLRAELGHRPQ